ncbi:restriction endonuclease subunit S [Nonlabens sp. Asnod3-A02]|uniref:restriction endonuclease subunit S n=1 Tax=Nonlabens sp. Asnod3-A02 TaxID=3160579 RepID=UPI00386E85A6
MELEMKKGLQGTFYGEIPAEWIACKFEDVLTGFSSGMTPYRGISEYYKGDIPWITSGELNYNIITDTIEKITKEAVVKTNLKILPTGTFLMAITGLEAKGTRGSCAITGVEATTNQSCMALFPLEGKADTGYLYHFYRMYGDVLAFHFCQGSKQQSYTGKIAKILPINLPPTLAEQKAIATALSDVDDLISSLDALIAKKKAIKQGAMQQLLTGRIRLNTFEKGKGYKETEIGLIPRDWEVVKIEDVFDFSGGSQPPKSTFVFREKKGYIRLLQIRDYKKDNYKTFIPLNLAQKQCSANDIMIGRYGPPIFQILRGIEGAYNVALLKAIPKGIDKEYGYHFLKQDTLFDFVEKLSQRSSGQTGVDLDQLKLYILPLPSTIKEQKAIAQILSDMDKELEELATKKEKYEHIKQGMMQELLTGKTRLI